MSISVVGDLLKTVNGIIESLTSNSKEKKKLKSEVSYAIIDSIDKVIEAKKEVIITEDTGYKNTTGVESQQMGQTMANTTL